MKKNQCSITKILCIVLCISANAWGKNSRVEDFLAYIAAHPDAPFCEPFFIPEDAPQSLLLELIAQEKQRIIAALFNFTEPDIATALIAAHARGVDVQIIADVEALRPRAERVTDLYDAGIPVLFYAKYRSLMHNKYVVFSATVGGKSVLWTGSANITKAGLNSNEENVLVTNDERLARMYEQAFYATKERIKKAKESKAGLRPNCSYNGNKLIVKLGRAVRRFRCF